MSCNVTTPLPANLSPKQALAALHNHDLMIKALCPSLISYAFETGDAETRATYSVTDKKPIGQTTYKLTLTSIPDGVDSLLNARPPVGVLTIAGKWRVRDGKLIEDIEIDGNFMMMKMAKGNVEKTHPEQHTRLLKQAAQG